MHLAADIVHLTKPDIVHLTTPDIVHLHPYVSLNLNLFVLHALYVWSRLTCQVSARQNETYFLPLTHTLSLALWLFRAL